MTFSAAPGVVVRIAGQVGDGRAPIETDKTLLEHGPAADDGDPARPARRAAGSRSRQRPASRLQRARVLSDRRRTGGFARGSRRFDPPRQVPIINVIGDRNEMISPDGSCSSWMA